MVWAYGAVTAPGRVPFRAAEPRLRRGTSAVLRDTCRAAAGALNGAWEELDRAELADQVSIGADGTPTLRIDDIVEAAILQAASTHRVNVLSEEAGFIDAASAVTLVVDPLDGTANAAAGVPLSCFSAALFVDGEVVEALSCWLETGHVTWARRGEPVEYSTSGVRRLDGAAVDMLRPKRHRRGDSTDAFVRVCRRAGRIRVLSSTCLEAILVAEGSIDAFVDPGSDTHRLVDLAAAMLLVPAAGGHIADVFGRRLGFDTDLTRRWSAVIAASADLAEQVAGAVTQG